MVSHPGAPNNSVYETPAETKYNHRVIVEKGLQFNLFFHVLYQLK